MNNRQPGRRRGRSGQRPQGNGGNRDNGNRIDNRARGNAPQLLEKYKTLARDAQMQGDRVLTEYYLQFADHYFRVVAESRARFEESRPRRDDWQGDDIGMPEGAIGAQDGDDGDDGQGYDNRGNEGRGNPRADNRDRGEERRPRRDFNRDRDEGRGDARPERAEAQPDAEPRAPRPPRAARRPARNAEVIEGPGTGALPADMLPPAIGIIPVAEIAADNDVVTDMDDAPAPRRRGRPARVKAEDAA